MAVNSTQKNSSVPFVPTITLRFVAYEAPSIRAQLGQTLIMKVEAYKARNVTK